MIKFYKGDIEPADDVIFVFGSNPEGRHGAGSAKVARMKFGAIYGVGEGLQGNAYAIPTKDLRVTKNKGYKSISPSEITFSIKKMLQVVKSMPDKKFMVAYRNKADERSLCGYTGVELLSCFITAMDEERFYPDNLYFSEEWHDILNYYSNNIELKSP